MLKGPCLILLVQHILVFQYRYDKWGGGGKISSKKLENKVITQKGRKSDKGLINILKKVKN